MTPIMHSQALMRILSRMVCNHLRQAFLVITLGKERSMRAFKPWGKSPPFFQPEKSSCSSSVSPYKRSSPSNTLRGTKAGSKLVFKLQNMSFLL